MLKFESVSRDRMFYDQYEYGICVSISEAGILRAKTSGEFQAMVEYRNHARSMYSPRQKISNQALGDLLMAFDALQPVRNKIKLVVSFDTLYIYSNDVKVLEDLANLPCVAFNNAVRSVVDKPRDVVLKTDPKFAYRSYFRDRTLTEVERDRLLNFLNTRTESFWVTSYFKNHLRSRYRWHYLQRHQFVEHNDAKDITMLSLVCPGLIRKTVSVQAK